MDNNLELCKGPYMEERDVVSSFVSRLGSLTACADLAVAAQPYEFYRHS